MTYRILIVAPGHGTKGGITSVINAYKNTFIWKKWNCVWIETHTDKSKIIKIICLIKGLINFLYYIKSTEIIHIHLSEPVSTLRKSIFINIAYIFKKKIIIHFHAYSPISNFSVKTRNMYLNLFKKCQVLIVLSKYWETEILRVCNNPTFQIKILNNPSTPHEYSINLREDNILYAGILNKRKGYEDLLYAFSNVVKFYPTWKLILAGNGELKNGQAIATRLNISHKVIFTGWISGSEKERVFRSASIFCLPSYFEGFPMAILDAWSFGLPVVTTPVGGLSDVLIDSKNALLQNPGDVRALTLNLERLISDEMLRAKLSTASYNLCTEVFNVKNIVYQLDEIYSSLIAN